MLGLEVKIGVLNGLWLVAWKNANPFWGRGTKMSLAMWVEESQHCNRNYNFWRI